MKSLIAIIAAIIVLGGAWYAYTTYYIPAEDINLNSNDTMPVGTDTSGIPNEDLAADVNAGVVIPAATMTASVALTTNGFSPKSVTIKKGGTVTFLNESGGKMWVATAQHPTHTVYAGTTLNEHCDDAKDVSFDQCKNSDTYSFMFDKPGTWNYHNHSVNGQFGSVVVVE